MGRRLENQPPPRQNYRRFAPRRCYFKPPGGRTAGDAPTRCIEVLVRMRSECIQSHIGMASSKIHFVSKFEKLFLLDRYSNSRLAFTVISPTTRSLTIDHMSTCFNNLFSTVVARLPRRSSRGLLAAIEGCGRACPHVRPVEERRRSGRLSSRPWPCMEAMSSVPNVRGRT